MSDSVYNRFFDKKTWELVKQDNKNILEDFLLELKQAKKSDGTISQYRSDLKGFLCWVHDNLDNKYILDVTKRDFRRYSLYLTEDCNVSAARHNRVFCSIRSMLTFVENDDDEYDYDMNVAKKVRGLSKDPVREIIFLTDEQIIKLKNELIKREEYQKATLLCLAYDSAGRRAELAGVKKDSFYYPSLNNTNKVIGKRRKQFALLYFSNTKECAKLWLEQRGNDDIDSLFVIGSKKNRRVATKDVLYDWIIDMRDILAEIEGKSIDFNPHSLRHSALQNMSDGSHAICKELGITNGFPIEKLKLIANHSDVSTTAGYLKDNSIDELAEMFNINIV